MVQQTEETDQKTSFSSLKEATFLLAQYYHSVKEWIKDERNAVIVERLGAIVQEHERAYAENVDLSR